MIETKANLRLYPIMGAHYRPPATAILNILPLDTPLYLLNDPNGTATNSDHNDPTSISIYISLDELGPRILSNDTLTKTFTTLLANCGWELEDVLILPFFHLGYIPKHAAALLKIKDHTPAKFTLLPNGKPAVTFYERPSKESSL